MKTGLACGRRDGGLGRGVVGVRSLVVGVGLFLVTSFTSSLLAQAPFKAVKVTDTKGVVTEIIRDPSHRHVITDIDYYVNPYIVGRSDLTLDGIRLRQGDGTVDVSWDRVRRIDITKEASSGLEAQLFLTSDPETPMQVVLISKTKQGIHGWTALAARGESHLAHAAGHKHVDRG